MNLMDEASSQKNEMLGQEKFTSSTFYRVATYALVRTATIAVTIFIGVFITVVMSNRSGQIDQNVQEKIEVQVRRETYGAIGVQFSEDKREEYEKALYEEEEKAGLHLPFLPRHLRWTLNALTLDWGDVLFDYYSGVFGNVQNESDVKTIVASRLPSTLLLVGTAYLIIFLFGIPIALSISRKHGAWQDRLFSFLAPISSIPSWVLGVFLIMIFAVEFRLLPMGGMFGIFPPETREEYIRVVLQHMVLPVSAIVLGLLFQLIHTWRTFYLIYSKEYYVELAQAKGLSARKLQKDYIQKPSLPFIITSFAITLAGFWQMTTVLEIIFRWPGIGQLYFNVLPNFLGEAMDPGELVIVVALVVVFAYLLGGIVLILDVVYAFVDPRIRVGSQSVETKRVIRKVRRRSRIKRGATRSYPTISQSPHRTVKTVKRVSNRNILSYYLSKIKTGLGKLKSFMRELVRYPSAVFGLLIIFILVVGSAYAVITLPYMEVADIWRFGGLTGKYYNPHLAWPEWLNLFRSDKLLSSIVIRSQDDPTIKSYHPGTNQTTNLTMTFTFDYSFAEAPDELTIFFEPHYEVKRPFVSMTWVTPDGRENELKAISPVGPKGIHITEQLQRTRLSWGELANVSDDRDRSRLGDEELFSFFENPEDADDFPYKGEYTLRLDGILFEEDSDFEAELVVLGQVYGVAGTDSLRRDLIVPLLWGMPFALAFGLIGTVLTTIVSMILAAAGVWFGRWVDTFVQRLTEANIILPLIGISVLLYALYNVDLWTILAIVIVLNAFGSPTKSFRAAFMQVSNDPYIEAAQTYGASNWRIVFRYMVPRVIPVLIPQLVTLIPSYVFLEATLGMLNIKSIYPTWGKVIYQALMHGFSYSSRFWVLQPLVLLLLTGFAFAMLGSVLDRILNPRLRGV